MPHLAEQPHVKPPFEYQTPSFWQRLAFWKVWRRRRAEKLLTDSMRKMNADWAKRGLTRKPH